MPKTKVAAFPAPEYEEKTMLADTITCGQSSIRDKRNPVHIREDLELVRRGILDRQSFASGYRKWNDTVETVFRNSRGKVTAIRRSHNSRTVMGRDQWQRLAMFGNISANATFASAIGTASTTTATSLAIGSSGFPTSGGPNGGLQGQIVVAMSSGTAVAWGVIVSNSATTLNVDQWYNPTSTTGAAGTTPSTTTPYIVLPNAGMALWMGLSSDDTAIPSPNTDVLITSGASAGLFSNGSSSGTATEYVGNGLGRQFTQPTFPAAGQIQLQNTFTYS
ncbi:MAG TPA: hypothetical protein VKT72_06140, partial [Candidatus Baltobacteraceae bacterium]|nr:hypothetical protein [Candidatus Baltobacteraceae bacterium]